MQDNKNLSPESDSKGKVSILEELDSKSEKDLGNIIEGADSIVDMMNSVENAESIESGGESTETQEKKAKGGGQVKKDEDGAQVFLKSEASIVYPSQRKMVFKIRKEMTKELKNLQKQAKKYKRPWSFSPHKLCEVVSRIRKLRLLIESLARTAVEKIKKLYVQWVANHDHSF